MNYKETIREMMLHLSSEPENFQANFNEILCAFGIGICNSFCTIDDHDQMHKTLDLYLAGIAAYTCINHKEFSKFREQERLREQGIEISDPVKPVDFSTFLRDVFQPTNLND